MRLRTGLLLTAAICALVGGADANAARPRRAVRHFVGAAPPAYPPSAELLSARSLATARRFQEAQTSLERAEARLLDEAASPAARPPFFERALTDIAAARENAARSQRDNTLRFINDALLSLEPRQLVEVPVAPIPVPTVPLSPPPSPPAAPLAETAPPPPAPPAILYRQEAGHWTLRGADSVWVPGETVPRPVSVATVVPTREVWNGDRWVLVPEHFARVSP